MSKHKVEEMWTALAAYQPQADAAGHGQSWARMCKEKTVQAARAADAAAYRAAYRAAADAAADAARAAAAAADTDAKKWAQMAIARMTRVLVKPAPPVQPAVPDAITDSGENPKYRTGCNERKAAQAEHEADKVIIEYHEETIKRLEAAILAEREACAKECKFDRTSADIEIAIRARGNK